MKKLTIIFSAVVAVALLATLAIPQGSMQRGGTNGPITYSVVAKNAPGTFRRGGPNTWLCSGADDHVQIQLAIDAATAAGTPGGGVVQLSPGTFYLDKPTAAVAIDGTCVLTTESSTSTCTGVVSYDAGTHADVVVGMNFRLSGGDDGSANTMEASDESMIPTCVRKTVHSANVTSITYANADDSLSKTGIGTGVVEGDYVYVSSTGTDAVAGWYVVDTGPTANKITLTTDPGVGDQADFEIVVALEFSEPIYEAYGVGADTDVNFDRIIGSIVLKPQVTLKGAGIDATFLRLELDANCTVLVTENSIREVYTSIRELSLHGNLAQQGDYVTTNFNGLYNGYVLNEFTWDVHITDVSTWNCKGDGVWIDQPWGLRLKGGWSEFCVGAGMSVGDGNGAWISGHKIGSNLGKTADATADNGGFNLHHTQNSYLNHRVIKQANGWAIRTIGAGFNTFAGITISGESGSTGCVLHGYPGSPSYSNKIVGCNIMCTSNKGVELANGSYSNIIVGNSFTGTPTPALTVGTFISGVAISGNIGLPGGPTRPHYNDQERADDSAITCGVTMVRVVGDPGDVLLDTDPAIADGYYDGQTLTIQGTDDAKEVQIADGANVQLAGAANMVLHNGDIIVLVWDEADDLWYEVSRSEN